MNSYHLSRQWFDFCFDNPEKIKPAHTALYFFILEHCNRLGWKEKFGLPMEMAKDAIGISNYKTYSKTFNDLTEWGFIKVLQQSKNQYSSTIIALVENTKANTKALSKAMQSHNQKQQQKQVHGIVCIDKPITLEPDNLNNLEREETPPIEKIISMPVVAEKEKEKSCAQKEKALGFLGQFRGYENPLYLETWVRLCDQPHFRDKPAAVMECLVRDLRYFDEDYAIGLMEYTISSGNKAVIYPETKLKYQQLKSKQNGTANTKQSADEKRSGVKDLAERSTEFLRQLASQNTG